MGAAACSAQTMLNSTLQLDASSGIHNMKNGTAAQDAVTYSQLVSVGTTTPPSYKVIVMNASNGNYIAEFSTGAAIYTGTNASRAIIYGLNNLTSGRNYKERILLKGEFYCGQELNPLSYTIFDLSEGRIEATANPGEGEHGLIRLNANVHDVDFVGGIFDNGAGVAHNLLSMTGTNYNVNLNGCSFIQDSTLAHGGINIYGQYVNIDQCNFTNIWIVNLFCAHGRVTKSTFIDMYDSPISMGCTVRSAIHDNYVGQCYMESPHANFAIDITDGISNVTVRDTTIKCTGQKGIMIHSSAHSLAPENVTIDNVQIFNGVGAEVDSYGVAVSSYYPPAWSSGILIENCLITGMGTGIGLWDADNVDIIGNDIYDNTYAGIITNALAKNSFRNRYIDNTIHTSVSTLQNYGMVWSVSGAYRTTNSLLSGNFVYGHSTNILQYDASHVTNCHSSGDNLDETTWF